MLSDEVPLGKHIHCRMEAILQEQDVNLCFCADWWGQQVYVLRCDLPLCSADKMNQAVLAAHQPGVLAPHAFPGVKKVESKIIKVIQRKTRSSGEEAKKSPAHICITSCSRQHHANLYFITSCEHK